MINHPHHHEFSERGVMCDAVQQPAHPICPKLVNLPPWRPAITGFLAIYGFPQSKGRRWNNYQLAHSPQTPTWNWPIWLNSPTLEGLPSSNFSWAWCTSHWQDGCHIVRTSYALWHFTRGRKISKFHVNFSGLGSGKEHDGLTKTSTKKG